MEKAKPKRGEGSRRDTETTYPTKKDWEDHLAAFWDITLMWVQMIEKVDFTMQDVTAWRSVSAEEVGLSDIHLQSVV
jgi:hypothetical protein